MAATRLARHSLTYLGLIGLLGLGGCGESGGNLPGDGGPSSGGRAPGSSGGGANPAGGTSSTGGASPGGGGQADGAGASGGALPSGGGAVGGGSSADGGNPKSSGGDSGVGGGSSSGGTDSGNTGGALNSTGCGKAALSSGKKTIQVGSDAREYILKIPDTYDANKPYRLIMGYHGRMYDAEWVANGEPPLTGPYFGLESESKGEAIFVATQALSSSWDNQDGRDIEYTKAIVAELSDGLCIDQNRIFATGFSYGAIMTIRIGCELAGMFRAIAPMSGSLQNQCPENDKQVAYWASHGLNDTTIKPELGEAARDEFIKRNHCSTMSDPSEPAGCVKYRDCDPGYPVSFCTFDGVHEPAPFAGTAIWAFLSQF